MLYNTDDVVIYLKRISKRLDKIAKTLDCLAGLKCPAGDTKEEDDDRETDTE